MPSRICKAAGYLIVSDCNRGHYASVTFCINRNASLLCLPAFNSWNYLLIIGHDLYEEFLPTLKCHLGASLDVRMPNFNGYYPYQPLPTESADDSFPRASTPDSNVPPIYREAVGDYDAAQTPLSLTYPTRAAWTTQSQSRTTTTSPNPRKRKD